MLHLIPTSQIDHLRNPETLPPLLSGQPRARDFPSLAYILRASQPSVLPGAAGWREAAFGIVVVGREWWGVGVGGEGRGSRRLKGTCEQPLINYIHD